MLQPALDLHFITHSGHHASCLHQLLINLWVEGGGGEGEAEGNEEGRERGVG